MPLSAQTLSDVYPRARASGDSQANAVFSANGTVLIAQGVCITPINIISPRLEPSLSTFKDIIHYILTWHLFIQVSSPPGYASSQRLDQFYRMIMFDQPEFRSKLPDIRLWWPYWQRTLIQQRSAEALEAVEEQKIYLQYVFDCCAGRQLFLFEGSQAQSPLRFNMGMCPKETAEGDLLCVLLGCKIPVVLRPRDGYYMVIGEAFVPDYMHGEAMEEMARGICHLQSFTIR
jgi:hypothetical protein